MLVVITCPVTALTIGCCGAGKPRLVDADVAEQVVPACADVGDFEQQVLRERILKAGVVLMKVSRAQTAIKRTAAKGDAGDERGELILRRQRDERVFQTNQSARRTPANGVGRRSVNRVVDVSRGGPRIEDAVAAAQRQAPRIKRRVGKAYSRAKVIRVNAREDALADVRHVGQVVLRDHIPCLHEPADGRADGVAARVHLHPRLIKRRVESRQSRRASRKAEGPARSASRD